MTRLKHLTLVILVTALGAASAEERGSYTPFERKAVGVVRIVGVLQNIAGYPAGLLITPEAGSAWAEFVDLPRPLQGRSDLFETKNHNSVVEVVGEYTSFTNHRRSKDLLLGEIKNLRSWRIVPAAAERGIWKVLHGERVFPLK